MPVYEFESPGPQVERTRGPDFTQAPAELPGVRQLSHVGGGRVRYESPQQTIPSYTEEFLQKGFHPLDEAMKHYFSGIRVPMKDSYRFMRVRVAGGDKSLGVWRDQLVGGRARLPVAAIDRGDHQFNPDKWSNSTLPMAIRYPSRRGDRALKVFRPVPYLVSYKLIVWAEHKGDAEHILYQIATRFNPLAEFRMFDGHLQGTVTLQYGGLVDASDKEVGHDQHANIRYEVSTTAEAWLPLPEQLVPTVLGQITTLRERTGEILFSRRGNQ